MSQHLQDCIVKLCIFDDSFIKIARYGIKREYFDSTVTEVIISLCYSFYDQFGVAPKDHFYEEIERKLQGRKDGEFFIEYLEKLDSISNVNNEYVISKVSDYIKTKEFETAALKFIDLIGEKDLEQARTLMLEALKAGIHDQEKGLWYLQSKIPSYLLPNSSHDVLMSTGIDELDKQIEGYKRGRFICFLGGPKGKKTWSLVHLGKNALLTGLNVVHISHEVSKEELEQRYDMAFGSLTNKKCKSDVTYCNYNKRGEESSRKALTRDTTLNLPVVQELHNKLRGKIGQLVIKKYPPGNCSISEIDRFLNYLEIYENFTCDVLINDYIDIMKMPSDKAATRDNLNALYLHHKRIADERNILVATVSQLTRYSYRKGKLSSADFAEDFRKAANVDLAIGLVETDEEAQNNQMRIWVIVNRTGRMDCGCCISNNIEVGQFCIDSWPLQAYETNDEFVNED